MQDWRGKNKPYGRGGEWRSWQQGYHTAEHASLWGAEGKKGHGGVLEGDFPSFIKFARRVRSLVSARNKSSI